MESTIHWPTYRKVMEIAADCAELVDAKRHGDYMDVEAYKCAPTKIREMAELAEVENEAVLDIIGRCVQYGSLSERQAKFVAIKIAEGAAALGMTGSAALTRLTEHRLAGEGKTLVNLDHSESRIFFCMVASKKRGEPFLAKLGPTLNDRDFVKKIKGFTNSMVDYVVEKASIGDVYEYRAYNWNGGEHEGESGYLVVSADGIWKIGHEAALAVLAGATEIKAFWPLRLIGVDQDTNWRVKKAKEMAVAAC